MSHPQSKLPRSVQDFAAKLTAAGVALATVSPELPPVHGVTYFRGADSFRLVLLDSYYGWRSVAYLAAWAEAFDTTLYVSLSSGGSGEVAVSFVIGGVNFDLSERIGTAEAYQLGAVMNRTLNPDKGLSLTPAEMRSALTLIGGA